MVGADMRVELGLAALREQVGDTPLAYEEWTE